MFFVSRMKYDELLDRYEVTRLDRNGATQQLNRTESELASVRKIAEGLMAKSATLQADNEALLRFAAATKAALDKLADELAAIAQPEQVS
jgi:hypothetical protein